MTVSFDQVRRQSVRALDAGGAAPGIDEDSALAIAWLEAARWPGLRILADALDASEREQRGAGLELGVGDPSALDAGGRSAVFFAASAIDHLLGLAARDNGQKASLRVIGLQHPLVLLAAASRFAPAGQAISIEWPDAHGRTFCAVAMAGRAGVFAGQNCAAEDCDTPGVVSAVLGCRPAGGEPAPPGGNENQTTIVDPATLAARIVDAYQNGLNVDPRSYERVSVYASKILVPETEESLLHGAGAGLTDND